MSLCKKCKSEASVNSCDRCDEPMDKFIDKQRVRDAIEKIFPSDGMISWEYGTSPKNQMYKELGL